MLTRLLFPRPLDFCLTLLAEWYRGVVVQANSNEYTYDVMYDDGDIDRDLKPECVRRFEPYAVDEEIDVRVDVDRDVYASGRVVKVHEGEGDDQEILYDVQTGMHGLHSKMSASNLRRLGPKQRDPSTTKVMKNNGSNSYGPSLQAGTLISARYQGKDKWFPGRVVQTNSDGTYAIQYDDGDFEGRVHIQNIRPRNSL